jgi:hypothetical protein
MERAERLVLRRGEETLHHLPHLRRQRALVPDQLIG